jgi:transposase
MKRFIEGADRSQVTLLPECLDDYIAEDNPVRVVDAYVEELDLQELGFDGAEPALTGRPSYHPAILLKIYIYGYLNRIQSSRRLEREAQRNVELMWLTGRLAPDFKTIADFRRNNGVGIRNVCQRFIVLCRDLKLFSEALVAIDGSKFKAVNSRDRNYTPGKIDKRQQQIQESIQRYLDALETADRTQPPDLESKTERLTDKIDRLRRQMRQLDQTKEQLKTQPDGQLSLTDPGRPFDDLTWQGHRHRRLQRPGRSRRQAPPDRRPRGHQCWQRPGAAQPHGAGCTRSHGQGKAEGGGRPRLLQRAADQGLPRRRHRDDPAQADDVQRQGRGALRQS